MVLRRYVHTIYTGYWGKAHMTVSISIHRYYAASSMLIFCLRYNYVSVSTGGVFYVDRILFLYLTLSSTLRWRHQICLSAHGYVCHCNNWRPLKPSRRLQLQATYVYIYIYTPHIPSVSDNFIWSWYSNREDELCWRLFHGRVGLHRARPLKVNMHL